MNCAGPEYCMAVTVWSSGAMSIPAISWAAISLAQSRVTASASVRGSAAIASASATKRSASARQARAPSSLWSGTRSSYPGMPYMLAANGFCSSHRSWKRSASSRAVVMILLRKTRIIKLNGRWRAHPAPVLGPPRAPNPTQFTLRERA